MWQAGQVELLKKEIEAVLAQLSSTPSLYQVIREPLLKARRGLAGNTADDRPWPLLPLITCEAVSGCCEPAVPAAAALQLLLAAGDVFDDVEDDDSSESLAARYGPAVAVNAATTLLVLAERAMTRLMDRGVSDRLVIRAMETVNSYYTTACAGQHLDLSEASNFSISEESYLKIIGMKSAAQVECACCVGALLGGASGEPVDALSTFGYNLGMMAQITNDIQGISRGSDIISRNITLPVIYALAQAEGEDSCILDQHFRQPPGLPPDPVPVKNLLFRTGAIYYATIKMESYRQIARDNLSNAASLGINTERLKTFLE